MIHQFSLVAQLCPTLRDPMDCSMPGFTILHHLPELAQTYVHWVSDVTQTSHPCCSLLLLPSIFPSIRILSNELALPSGGQSIGASASGSVLPMNIQSWFPLGFTGVISLQSKRLSRVFSNTTVQNPSKIKQLTSKCKVCLQIWGTLKQPLENSGFNEMH